MCNSSQWVGHRRRHRHPRPASNRCSLRLHRLNRKKLDAKMELRMMNLKLYMENQSMIEENEKLKKRVVSLHQENLLLSTQLQTQQEPDQEPNQEPDQEPDQEQNLHP